MLTSSAADPSPSLVARLRGVTNGPRRWLGRGVLAATDQALISGSNFVVNILLARWLGAYQYGLYAFTYSVFLFLVGFHNSLLVEPMAVFGPARFREAMLHYVRRLVTLHWASSVVLTIGGAVAVLALVRPAPADLLWALVPVCVLVPLFWMLRRAAYLQPDPFVGPMAALIYNLVSFSSLGVIRAVGALGLGTAFLTQSVGALAASLYLLRRLRPSSDRPVIDLATAAIVRTHWEYGQWACATNVVYWLAGEAYVALIGMFLKVEDIAALRAMQNLTAPFPQLVTALTMLLLPQASAAFVDAGVHGLRRVINRAFMLVAAGALGYFLFLLVAGERLAALLYGGKYATALHLLPYIAASAAVTAVAQALLLGLRGMQAASTVFGAYLAASVITVVAGAGLTRTFGLNGAVAGVLLTSLTLTCALGWQYLRRLSAAVPAA